MPGVVFAETLRRGWRTMLVWGIGIGLIAMMQILILPDVDALKQFAQIFETLPSFMLSALGGGDAAYLGTPEGYLAARFFSIALLIFGIYALNSGLNVTSSEEERGILDIVLSLPVPRWRLVVERLAAHAVLLAGALGITLGLMLASLQMTPVITIETGRILTSTLNIVPGTLLVLAFSTLVGAIFRSRALAVGVAVSFLISSFFVDFIGAAANSPLTDALQTLSFYAYYDSTEVMKNGLSGGNIILLLSATAICVMGSLWFFQRRDIGL
jgi:ABC-2 type transport system permease protein